MTIGLVGPCMEPFEAFLFGPFSFASIIRVRSHTHYAATASECLYEVLVFYVYGFKFAILCWHGLARALFI